MNNKVCSLCTSVIESEDSAILTMGKFGNPKYLCGNCDEHLEIATSGTDFEKIEEAFNYLSDVMAAHDIGDETVLTTMNEMLTAASERAKEIKAGSYDFSLDELPDEEIFEIPEDMKVSEEELREEEELEEKNKKIDKIITWVSAGIFAAFIIFFIIKFFIL